MDAPWRARVAQDLVDAALACGATETVLGVGSVEGMGDRRLILKLGGSYANGFRGMPLTLLLPGGSPGLWEALMLDFERAAAGPFKTDSSRALGCGPLHDVRARLVGPPPACSTPASAVEAWLRARAEGSLLRAQSANASASGPPARL